MGSADAKAIEAEVMADAPGYEAAFASSRDPELWVMLLEKAYAKFIGARDLGYQARDAAVRRFCVACILGLCLFLCPLALSDWIDASLDALVAGVVEGGRVFRNF
jgi:hypothetical protein